MGELIAWRMALTWEINPFSTITASCAPAAASSAVGSQVCWPLCRVFKGSMIQLGWLGGEVRRAQDAYPGEIYVEIMWKTMATQNWEHEYQEAVTRTHVCTQAHTHVHMRTHTHVRTRTHTHARTHMRAPTPWWQTAWGISNEGEGPVKQWPFNYFLPPSLHHTLT